MSNKVYDVLKYIALIALPAITTFYGVLSSTWGWNYTEEILTTLTAFDAMLGTLLKLSTIKYNRENEKNE